MNIGNRKFIIHFVSWYNNMVLYYVGIHKYMFRDKLNLVVESHITYNAISIQTRMILSENVYTNICCIIDIRIQ